MPKFKIGNRPSFETTAAGIPCTCVIVGYEPYVPARRSGSLAGPEESASAEWILLDRRGYRARWLEDKLTAREESQLDEDALEACG